jgi:hypothetical protein
VILSLSHTHTLSLIQEGRTPLHLACTHGRVEVVSEVLEAGAQIEALDNVSWILWSVILKRTLSLTPLCLSISEQP